VEPSPSSERRKTTDWWRSSWCPSLGCSTLGAELEQNGEDANDLDRIVLPLLGSDLSLIYRDRLGTWQFGGLRIWSTCARVQEGLVVVLYGPWQYCGAEEALGIIRLLCLDTMSVRLCRLRTASPRCVFWSLLGDEGGWLEGMMHGPGSLGAPGGHGGTCLLVSCPVRVPVRGAVDRAAPKGQRRGAPKP
jgi:hypothetical protein